MTLTEALNKADRIEVQPCTMTDEGFVGGVSYEPCEPDDPDLFCWGVYTAGDEGVHLADCPTQEQAEWLAGVLMAHKAAREAFRSIGCQSVGSDWSHEQAFDFMRNVAKKTLSIMEGGAN